jgi:1,4-dihydroxy-2-naphthoyl-CoA hydrolase
MPNSTVFRSGVPPGLWRKAEEHKSLSLIGAVDDLYPSPFRYAGTLRHPHYRRRQEDKLVGELDADERHLNNSGHVHGGALAAFADDLGGALAGLNVSPGFRTTTIESKTNIFRACEPGRLTGVAVPVHVGRRTIVLQTSIYRADGKLAAMMIQTQMVLPRGSAAPAGEGGGEA